MFRWGSSTSRRGHRRHADRGSHDRQHERVQALSKGALTTASLAAADAAAAAAIDRLTRNASSIPLSGHVNYGRKTVFDRETQ